MRIAVPPWVNVVLEGGGLKLERALLAHQQLSKLLKGDWRPRAREVEALTRQILADELELNALERRAVRRSALSQLTELEALTQAVASARAGLIERLCSSEEALTEDLRALESAAAPEARRWRAWEEFCRTRFVFTALSAAFCVCAAAEVLASPYQFDTGIPAPFTISCFAVFVFFSYFQFIPWQALGVRIPTDGFPLFMGALALIGAVVAGVQAGIAIELAVTCTLLYVWSILSWHFWRAASQPPASFVGGRRRVAGSSFPMDSRGLWSPGEACRRARRSSSSWESSSAGRWRTRATST